jgi:hypothetical protein
LALALVPSAAASISAAMILFRAIATWMQSAPLRHYLDMMCRRLFPGSACVGAVAVLTIWPSKKLGTRRPWGNAVVSGVHVPSWVAAFSMLTMENGMLPYRCGLH